MEIWKYIWFQNLVAFCRKWQWFDTYIYGKSVNLEDFVRNPAEIMRDTYFPFIVKGVTSYSVINVRLGYIPPDGLVPAVPNNWSVPMGERKLIWKSGKWVIADLRLWNPWYTKFCNCLFFFQFAISIKKWALAPFISINFRIGKDRYMQLSLGWGAESHIDANRVDAVLSGKLRYVNQVTSNEQEWNPGDVREYFEGTI